MRVIALVFTGGTISMRFDAAAGGVVPSLGADEILEAAAGIFERVALEDPFIEFLTLPAYERID